MESPGPLPPPGEGKGPKQKHRVGEVHALHEDAQGGTVVLHKAAQDQHGTQKSLCDQEQAGPYGRSPDPGSGRVRKKRPRDKCHGQRGTDPCHGPVREFNDRGEAWMMRQDFAITQRPVRAAACSRAGRADNGPLEHDKDHPPQCRQCEEGQSLAGAQPCQNASHTVSLRVWTGDLSQLRARAPARSVARLTALIRVTRRPPSSSSRMPSTVQPAGVVTSSLRSAGCAPVSRTIRAAP